MSGTSPENHYHTKAARLKELMGLFLVLGCTSFGGPAAHIALMEAEVVRRRNWMTREKFLDMLGMTNLIPGPNSTELAIHIGFERAGLAGLVVAGTCFILPAVVIVSFIAWGYVHYGHLPAATAVLYGVKPVVIAVVAQALWGLGRTAVKTWVLGLIGAAGIALNVLGFNELVLLFCAGLLMILLTKRPLEKPSSFPLGFFGLGGLSSGLVGTSATAAPFGLWPLFGFFLKTGSVLFGSGYVLIAFLRADLVERWHWLTEAQLIDAIAIGQVTPGPVFTTATFVGYLLAGPAGAAVATLGIFIPAFVFVALSAPFISKMRRSPQVGAFLDGVNVASLALMAVVSFQLARTAIIDFVTVALALVSGFLLIRYKVNSAWLVLGGALVGLAASYLHNGMRF